MSRKIQFTKDKDWLYENYIIKGLSRELLAEEANVSLATIKHYIRLWNIKKDKLIINKDDLLNYINEGLTTPQIAEKYNCDKCTIFRYLKKYNISERNYEINEQYDNSNDLIIIDLYNKGKSSIEIGKILNMSATSVQTHLKHNNIKLRSASECMWNYHNKEIPKDFDDYLKLYNLYIENAISKAELARRYNCSIRIIDNLLQKHNIIKTRQYSDYRKLYEKIRSYFYKRQTQKVLDRDNNTCQLCGCHEKLQIHHIVPFKLLFHNFLEKHNPLTVKDNFLELFELAIKDEDFNNIDNLITYCKNCHMYKVHEFCK